MIKNYFKLIVALVFVSNVMAQNVPSYVPTNGLVGWWPFNGNANDESGNGNNGTVTNATLIADRNGIGNSAYDFNSNAQIVCPKNNIPSQTLSLSVWIKQDNLFGGQFVCLGSSASTTWGAVATNNNLELGYGAGCGGNGGSILNSTAINTNEWIHLVYVSDGVGGNTKIYKNGTYVGQSKNSTSIGNCSSQNLYFGVDIFSAPEYMDAKLDDIAIYNRALTQQEITALYTSTPIAQNVPSYVPTNGLVGYWPFNGNADDESGNGNNGTVNGATLTTDRNGIANKSYSFDGTTSFIALPLLNLNTKSEITISSWVKITDFNTNYSNYHIIRQEGTGSLDWLLAFQNNGNTISFGLGIQGKAYSELDLGITATKFIESWHNIIATYDGSYKRIYLDGVLLGSESKNGLLTYTNSGSNSIGSACSSINCVEKIKGTLDDIAIYNRALTQQEITALYNGGSQSTLASTKVYVDAPATVNQNDTLQLSISTETLNSVDNVIAYQTDFSYDTTRYTYVSNNLLGTLNPSGNVVVNSSKNGKLSISYMTQTALSGAGSLVKLKFKANKNTGNGIFGLSNFLYNTTAITSLKSDTVNTIDVTPPTAKITYSQNPVRKGDSLLITVNFNEKMAFSPVPQLNLTGQNTLANTNLTKVNDTTYTYWWVVEKGNGAVNVNLAIGQDLAGNVIVATPTENTSFTVLPTVFGDIDTNTLVQAYDAALALQYSVGLNPLPTMDPLPWSNWRIAVANVDTVGNVTANDASLILQHSAKLISTFPADAKKRGGDAPVANVTVTQEGNQLVFRATGTLYAFNVFMKDNFNVFGQPEVKDKSAMVASNINTTTYNVGLASTTPFVENDPFLVIPILTNDNVQGTMDIVANTQEKSLSYGKAAGITSINKEVVLVYPNPTKDVVTINNVQGKTLRIVDVQGKEVYNQKVSSSSMEVSMKAIATRGTYVLHILDVNNETIQTKQIVLE